MGIRDRAKSMKVISPEVSCNKLSLFLLYLSDKVYTHIHNTNPDEQNDNTPEYGYEFKNEVFEMHPYFWGECTCGFDEREEEWYDTHTHSPECYQTALAALERGWAEKTGRLEEYIRWGYFKFHDLSNRQVIEEAYDKDVEALCNKFGLSTTGCMVHCTCSYDGDFYKFIEGHGHDKDCLIVRPNFRHFGSGLEVRWYKHIGRGMSSTIQDIPKELLDRVEKECLNSLEVQNEEGG